MTKSSENMPLKKLKSLAKIAEKNSDKKKNSKWKWNFMQNVKSSSKYFHLCNFCISKFTLSNLIKKKLNKLGEARAENFPFVCIWQPHSRPAPSACPHHPHTNSPHKEYKRKLS